MKITLIHCYSDFNKGDAGIILSIIDLIKKGMPEAIINMMSTYAYNDKRIEKEHYLTAPYVTNLLGALFPEPFISKDGKTTKTSIIQRTYLFFILLSRAVVILLFPNNFFSRLFFSKKEQFAFSEFLDSDLIISKGGSFLYSFKGFRGLFFFTRIIYPFYLAVRTKKKVVIYSQSIGPFENIIAAHLFKYIAPKLHSIYLREKSCLKYFTKFNISTSNVHIIPDSAFYLDISTEAPPVPPPKSTNTVGITVRYHRFDTNQTKLHENYMQSFVDAITHLITKEFEVYLFPQVIGPSAKEDDRIALKEIYSRLGDNEKNHTILLEKDYTPRHLKQIYSTLDFFIATRLHSAIFAMSSGIPTITISYHGSKAKGIMRMIGFEDNCISINKITGIWLKECIEKSLLNKQQIKEKMLTKTAQFRNELEKSMQAILTS